MRVLFYCFFLFSSSASAADLKPVSFFQDTVTDLDGRVIKFLVGSSWLLEREIIAVPFSDSVVVCDGPAPVYNEGRMEEYLRALPTNCVISYAGNQVRASRIDGAFLLEDGFLTEVIESLGNGAVLKTSDGSLWAIPSYDQYDTGYWLPPYPVLILSSGLYMINIDDGKKVWIEKRLK